MTEALRPVRNAIRVPARNPYEEAIAGIWREVLHRSDVGVFDDFFDLDGQSLLAIKVVTRIRKALGVAPARRKRTIGRCSKNIFNGAT